ncbi:MAG: hypothetical protein IJ262_08945 [Clostridia bacterium]|nr:hypothetical protein [Clostridia bacterium]
MIKGINRQVVEVSETGCDYFEKIMFFVKPEYASLSESRLKETAGKIARSAGAPPFTKKKKPTFFEVGKIILSLLTGAAMALTVMNILK